MFSIIRIISLKLRKNKIYIYLKTIDNLFKDIFKTVTRKEDFIELIKTENIPRENELLTTDGGGSNSSRQSIQPRQSVKKPLNFNEIRKAKLIADAKQRTKENRELTLKSKRMSSSVFNKHINGYSDLLSNFRLNKTLPLSIIQGIQNKGDLKPDIEDTSDDDNTPHRSKWISNAAQCSVAGLGQGCNDRCYLCMIQTPPYTSEIGKCGNWINPNKLITRECEHVLFFNLAYQLNALTTGNIVDNTQLNTRNYKWSHKLCNGTHKSQACFIDYDIISNIWFINDSVIKAVLVSILSDLDWQTIIWPDSNSEWCSKHGWLSDVNNISEENIQKLFETILNNIKNTVQNIVNILNLSTPPTTSIQLLPDLTIPDYTNWYIEINGITVKATIKKLVEYISESSFTRIAKNDKVYTSPLPSDILYEINTEYNKVIAYENALLQAKKDIEKRRRLAITDANTTLNELNILYASAKDHFIPPILLINILQYTGTGINSYQDKYDANFNDNIAPTLKDIEAKKQELKMLKTKPRLLFDSSKELDKLYIEIDDTYNKAITEYNKKIGGINDKLRKIREQFAKPQYNTIINIQST